MADALDSKSSGRKAVWVQVPPPAIRLGARSFSLCRKIDNRNLIDAAEHALHILLLV